MKTVSIEFHGRPLSIEVGRLAKQANGAAYIRYGDTIMLVTSVASSVDKEGADFLPLSVDYFEKFSSAGKIPGGFFRREGKQSERETLVSRLADRPIRPLFPETYNRETQVIANVLSFDRENDADVLSILGASCALHVSEIPFLGPIGAVRVGRVDGNWVINPKIPLMEKSDIDFIVAASRDAIVMVEGEAKEIPESEILQALKLAFDSIAPLLDLQDELKKAIGKEKWQLPAKTSESPVKTKIKNLLAGKLDRALLVKEKLPRYQLLDQTKQEILKSLTQEDSSYADKSKEISEIFHDLVSAEIRNRIIKSRKRIDDRTTDEIRPISIEVGLLPRTHGSALFTRGETQSVVTTTLGTTDDEQRVDSIGGEWKSRFMLHYNFPPFSVGEVKPLRGPARREIGHGVLAHKAIKNILPSHEDFPYTIRVVSDILESHGSSSMATVCGTTLSLMDAGVPIKAPVAGIAMGLMKEGDNFLVLSDISGDEDHIGDMDFKVAGTSKGVTAVQMDIKVHGISWEVLDQALSQARQGRLFILEKMHDVIKEPRLQLSPYAPRIETIQIHVDKIREVIGPGGKMIRSIVEKSQAKVEIDDTGKVMIASADLEALNIAREMIQNIIAEPEVGRIYKGKVRRIMEYGAFVEILPGTDGLVHISQIHADGRVDDVSDVLEEGDEIEVKVISIDHQGKIKLSQREAVAPGSGGLDSPEGFSPRRAVGGGERDHRRSRPPREDRPRGPRRSHRD